MTDENRPPDDQLLDELQDALREADPVPDDVLAAAKASFTWRTIDAELAELQFDSATDELAGVRSEGSDRQLTFRSPDLQVEVLVLGTDRRRITGQLVPPQPATVELRSEAGIVSCDAGADGVFSFAEVPSGPVSLRCSTHAEVTIATEWLVL